VRHQVSSNRGLYRLLSERNGDPSGTTGHSLCRGQVRESTDSTTTEFAASAKVVHEAQGQGPLASWQHEPGCADMDAFAQARHAKQLL